VSKRKAAPREDRRRRAIEINLLAEQDEGRNVLGRARRGCSLPFIGGALLIVLVQLLVHLPA